MKRGCLTPCLWFPLVLLQFKLTLYLSFPVWSSTKAAKQILSCFPEEEDISGKVGIEVHTNSPIKDDIHAQGREYLTIFSVLGLNSGS